MATAEDSGSAPACAIETPTPRPRRPWETVPLDLPAPEVPEAATPLFKGVPFDATALQRSILDNSQWIRMAASIDAIDSGQLIPDMVALIQKNPEMPLQVFEGLGQCLNWLDTVRLHVTAAMARLDCCLNEAGLGKPEAEA